ncbi:MAG: DUF3800 domain-containing protein [Protaetiibacter sp.]
MWVAYLDESAEDERVYMSMAAVLCTEAAIPLLNRALDRIVADAAAKWGTNPNAELHTTAMISRTEGWENLPGVDAAIEIIHEVLDALCAIDEVEFATRGLNVPKQRAKGYPEVWGPRRVLIQHVLEYCNFQLRAHGLFMVVVDEMSKPAEHRDLIARYRREGTPGFRHSKLERVVDNIYFMPSHYARGLQAADIVANVHRRWVTQNETTDKRARAATDSMWAKLSGTRRMRSYGTWP